LIDSSQVPLPFNCKPNVVSSINAMLPKIAGLATRLQASLIKHLGQDPGLNLVLHFAMHPPKQLCTQLPKTISAEDTSCKSIREALRLSISDLPETSAFSYIPKQRLLYDDTRRVNAIFTAMQQYLNIEQQVNTSRTTLQLKLNLSVASTSIPFKQMVYGVVRTVLYTLNVWHICRVW
jgi:hypothetical protein